MALFLASKCPGCGCEVFGGWIVDTGEVRDGCPVAQGWCRSCYKNLPEGAWLKKIDEPQLRLKTVWDNFLRYMGWGKYRPVGKF